MTRQMSFYDVITEAVKDMTERGYDSHARIDMWLMRITEAAKRDMISESSLRETLKQHLETIYRRFVEYGNMLKFHKGVSRFTIERVKPKLRNELDRRIMTSANLIRLNREESINQTLRRFSGWATSIPIGGTKSADKMEVKANIKKSLSNLPFEERRVLIDQGHKLAASLNDILARDNQAIAAEWHSHYKELNYNYRKDHAERDSGIYAIRGNWAIKSGLMKVGEDGYTDEITQPGEEVYCRCYYRYIYNLRDLPEKMLTAKGKAELARVRIDSNVAA